MAADDVQKYQNVPKLGLNFQTSLCPLSHDHSLRLVALGTLKIGNSFFTILSVYNFLQFDICSINDFHVQLQRCGIDLE